MAGNPYLDMWNQAVGNNIMSPQQGINNNILANPNPVNTAPLPGAPSPSSGGSAGGGWFDSNSWKSLENNPIMNSDVMQFLGKTLSGASNVITDMAPPSVDDIMKGTVQYPHPIDAFMQGFNDPANSSYSRLGAGVQQGFANALMTPQSKGNDPLAGFMQGWNNPTQAPTWRQNIDNTVLGGNDVPYLSDALGFGAGLVGNPANFLAPELGITKALAPVGRYAADLARGTVKDTVEPSVYRQAAEAAKSPMDMAPGAVDQMANSANIPSLADILNGQNQQVPFDIVRNLKGPKTAEDIMNTANWTSTPPMQNGRKLAQWIADTTSQLGFKPEEGWNYESLKGMPYKTLQDWAQQLIPDAQKLEAQNLAKTGFGADLNTLLSPESTIAGKTPDAVITRDQLNKILSGVQKEEQPKGTYFNPFDQLDQMINTKAEGELPPDFLRQTLENGLEKETNPSILPSGTIKPYGWLSQLMGNQLSSLGEKLSNGIPGAKQLVNTMGSMFQKYYGASPDLVNELNQTGNKVASNEYNFLQHGYNLADQYKGLTKQELEEIPHIMEGTGKVTNPQQQELANTLKTLMEEGLNGDYGAINEMKTSFNGQPVLEKMLQNYFPHIFKNSDEDIRNILAQTQNGKGLPISGFFNKERRFKNLRQAIAAEANPEMNPIVASMYRMSRGARAIENANLLNRLQQQGLIFRKLDVTRAQNGLETGIKNLDQYPLPHDLTESKVPELNGFMLRKGDEAALQQFLNPHAALEGEGSILGGARNAQNMYKKGMYALNPFPHLHNIGWNGVWLGGANPVNATRTALQLMKGKSVPAVEQAVKDGAISADVAGSLLQNLRQGVSKPGVISKGINTAHNFLWNIDKGIRADLHDQFLKQGMSPQEAANRVQHFMVNYHNLTPFEQKWMTLLMPFYGWTKGNYGLQLQQFLDNPIRSTVAPQNAIAQGSADGQNHEGKTFTGVVNPDGTKQMMDPYIPGNDILKLMSNGALPTAWSKSNPLLKFMAGLASNNKYDLPSGAVASPKAQGLVPTSGNEGIRNRLILDHDTAGDIAGKLGAHAINDLFSPVNGAIGNAFGINDLLKNSSGLGKAKEAPSILADVARLLGAFPGTENPKAEKLQQKDKKMNDKADLKEYRKENRGN